MLLHGAAYVRYVYIERMEVGRGDSMIVLGGAGAESRTGDSARGPWFELRFHPSVALIAMVRQFVADFFRAFVDEDNASRLALAAHELLENVAKYSVDGAAVLNIQVDAATGSVEVKTTNRAAPEKRDELRTYIDEIASAEDSMSFYTTMLRRSALRQDRSGGLGLARIRAESEMAIHLDIDGDEVQIRAQGSLLATG
jgi:hypothetical protein